MPPQDKVHDKSKTEQEDALDEALADSFPASDPVAVTTPHHSVRTDKHHIAEHTSSENAKDKK